MTNEFYLIMSNAKEINKMIEVMNEVSEIIPKLNSLSEQGFYPIYCMILEEYCKANNLDIIEVSAMIKELIDGVQETCGKY